MTTSVTVWTGKDWEARIQLLLKTRYPEGEYIEVPDKHQGDLGLEGFTRAGTAFQAYAPDGVPSTKALYENQRDKITADLSKLSKYEPQVQALLGTITLRRWLLVTPRHESKDLVTHCRKKEAELRNAGLPFIDPGFEVSVVDEDFFAAERAKLATYGAIAIRTVPDPAERDDAGRPLAAQASTLETIAEKARSHPHISTPEAVDSFVAEVAVWLVEGQNLLDKLEEEAPELHEQLTTLKASFERRVAMNCRLHAYGDDPLSTVLDCYDGVLAKEFGMMAHSTRSHIVNEAVADWLARCPLVLSGRSRD